MVGEESSEVGWEERNPDEEGGGNAQKDVPGFIEIVGKLPRQEG